MDSRASGVGGARGRGQTGWNQKQRIEFRFCRRINHLLCAILWHCHLSFGWGGGHQPGPPGSYCDICVARERRILVGATDEAFSQKPEFPFSDVIKSRWQPCQERSHYTTVSWRRRFKNLSQPRSIFQLLINGNSWYYYCTLVASEWGNIPSHCRLRLCDGESWTFPICDKLSSLANERLDHFECQLLMVLAC